MSFPIDVIFVDDKYQVVKIETGIKPNKIIWNKSKYVIELKEGMIKEDKVEVGDKLAWKE